MKVYGYVRVSTNQQDTEKQWNTVLNYANDVLRSPIDKIEDTASGKIEWRKRSLGNVVEQAQSGDVIVVSEISRLERSTLGVLDFLKVTAEKDIAVHIVQQGLVFKGQNDITSKIMATVLGMVAEIEREFISQRTRNALAKIKADGKQLGRPRGEAKKHRLDGFKNDIFKMIKQGVAKRSIARMYNVAPSTLYDFIHREERKAMKKQLKIEIEE
ncbi:recombinase family protein [Haemophilus influenzae]|nr:resolvase [Haemophilus influenzae]RFO69853.1 resolvase [Haemophilus influenzae]